MAEKFPLAFGRAEGKINGDQHSAGGFMGTSESYKKNNQKESVNKGMYMSLIGGISNCRAFLLLYANLGKGACL